MKLNLIILIINFFGVSFVYSQYSYEILLSTEANEVIIDLYEEENGNILAVGYEGQISEPQDYKGLIVKINPEGDTVIKRYCVSDTLLMFNKIVRSYDDSYYVFGSAIYSPEYYHDLIIIKMDTNLDIIWYKTYDFQEHSNYPIKIIPLRGNKGFYLVSWIIMQNLYQHLMLCRLNTDCDTLRSKIFYELGGGQNTHDALISRDSLHLYIIGTGYGSGAGSRLVIDTNFNLISEQLIPDQIDNSMTMEWFSDTTILLAGLYSYFDYGHQHDIEIINIDTSFSKLNSNVYGAEDTIDYPAAVKVLSFNHKDSILLYGTHHKIIDQWPEGISWISIYQLDSNLISRSACFFGGDAYYVAFAIMSTLDGGCIVSAERYDHDFQNQENDVYILKLKREDIITGVKERKPKSSSDNVIIYPNPGRNKIRISGLFEKANFFLYDLKGNMILELSNISDETLIDCSKLPSGLYLYAIQSKTNKTSNKKWIKL